MQFLGNFPIVTNTYKSLKHWSLCLLDISSKINFWNLRKCNTKCHFFPLFIRMQATIFFPKYEKKTPTKFVNLPSKIIKLMYYDIHKKKYLFIFFFSLQLVDVSEWSGNDNTSNVRLIFNNKWRPGVTVSSLIIQKVNSSHNGVFQCIPSNSEPKEIKVHVLKGMNKPMRGISDICKININFSKFSDDSKPAAIQTTNPKASSSSSSPRFITSWTFLTLLLQQMVISSSKL